MKLILILMGLMVGIVGKGWASELYLVRVSTKITNEDVGYAEFETLLDEVEGKTQPEFVLEVAGMSTLNHPLMDIMLETIFFWTVTGILTILVFLGGYLIWDALKKERR